MIDELKGKKVKIKIAFCETTLVSNMFHEGIVKTASSFGGEMFVVFEDNFMINAKYIQTIEIIG